MLGCAIDVHKQLGPELLESAYQECILHKVPQRRHKRHQVQFKIN
ncbi:GxxExxY protein [Winogradskyella sp. PC D3.3]